jgi:MoxR-like ATPase
VSHKLQTYVAAISRATRQHPDVRLGVSPRGSIALATAAQAYAATRGQEFVTADDVKAVAVAVLSHRLLLTSEARFQKRTPEAIVAEVMAGIPVPRDAERREGP